MICRFLSALGIGGEWAVGSSLLSETWPKRWRPWIAAVLQSGVNLGVILACAVVWLFSNFSEPLRAALNPVLPEGWDIFPRCVFLVGVLPAVLVWWIRRHVPEPEEWTAAKSKGDDAERGSITALFRAPLRRITLLSMVVCASGLTGWWATQFGTPNYAAHGGFCSVNMAAAGLYTFGGSFWEFGEPDWKHTKYFMLFGVAEDHGSNPNKKALGQLKARGAKIVSINPIRTGYSAIADEWIGIRPGTDGLFVGALIHELLTAQRIDGEYLLRYTNSPWLIIENEGGADDGLFVRNAQNSALVWDSHSNSPMPALSPDAAPKLMGRFKMPDGRRVVTAFTLIAERFIDAEWSAENVSERCGVPVETIRRIAAELARTAFEEEIALDVPWTDHLGRYHEKMVGRPVSMHAMRGISAHANGFQTCRTIHLLQILLGTIDVPGGFRYKPPFPKPPPPGVKPAGKPGQVKPNTPLPGPPPDRRGAPALPGSRVLLPEAPAGGRPDSP
jgi:anaerobic selenocysteine-containing dehydrogenase